MNLINLVLLGLGAKVLLSKSAPVQAKAIAPSGSTLDPATSGELSVALSPYAPNAALPSSKDPYKRPPTAVHAGENWGDDKRARERALHKAPLSADYVPDYNEMYEEKYGADALAAESAPLTVGGKSVQLERLNEVAKRASSRERAAQIREQRIAMDYDENDVSVAEDGGIELHKYRQSRALVADVNKDAAMDARSRAIEMAEDAQVIRENRNRSAAHGRDIERSIRRDIDPNLDMAFQQGYRGQMGGTFTKNPEMGFADAQPVSFREGNFDQSEVVASTPFNNALRYEDLYAKGQADWPLVSQQKDMNSDFAGVLVNEAGSADFSHDIVYDVKEDFGRR